MKRKKHFQVSVLAFFPTPHKAFELTALHWGRDLQSTAREAVSTGRKDISSIRKK